MPKAALTLLAGVLFIAGCGHKDDSSSSSTTTTTTTSTATAEPAAETGKPNVSASHDPCGLLTKADVQAVTHKPVADMSKTDETHCIYGSASSGALGMIIVEAAWTGADTQFQAGGMANAAMQDSEKAPKVGDASYSTAMGNVFYARKGDSYVGIDMRAASVPVKTVGPELARRALAKM